MLVLARLRKPLRVRLDVEHAEDDVIEQRMIAAAVRHGADLGARVDFVSQTLHGGELILSLRGAHHVHVGKVELFASQLDVREYIDVHAQGRESSLKAWRSFGCLSVLTTSLPPFWMVL